MRLNSTQAAALIRLKENPDFHHYMAALGDYAGQLTEQLIYAEPDKMHAMQGMTRGVVEIIRNIDKTIPIDPKTQRS